MKNYKYFQHKECSICGCKKFNIIFKFGAQYLVKCGKCGLIFFNKQRQDLEYLYDENYFNETKKGVANYSNYYDLDNREVMVANFKFAYNLISKNSNNKNLLDVGAGYGYFLKYLPKNLNTEAVEVSRVAAEELRTNKIKVYQCDILRLKNSRKYDFITSFDLIEHQVSLKEYLEKMNALLKSSGYFILTTPDYGSLLNKVLGKRATLIQPQYHNYYFEKKWIRENFPLFGFKVKYIKTTYITKMPLGEILMLISLSFPILAKINVLKVIQKTKIGKVVIPFIRLGGLQIIAQKI